MPKSYNVGDNLLKSSSSALRCIDANVEAVRCYSKLKNYLCDICHIHYEPWHKSPMAPHYLNPHADSFTPFVINGEYALCNVFTLNPLAKVFHSRGILNHNPSDHALTNNNFCVCIPISKPVSSGATIFIPKHYACNDIHVIITLLAFILTLMILFLNILYGLGKLSPKEELRSLKTANPNKLIIGHLNVNSIQIKFECLCDVIGRNVDMFLVSESKLNASFPVGQFLMNSFHVPFRTELIREAAFCFTYRNIFHEENSRLTLNLILKL